MMAAFAGLAAAAGTASGALGDPPSGAPSVASAYNYSGSLVGVQWANGDATAYTQIGLSGDSGTQPTSVYGSVAPGETSFETGTSTTEHWWVRHFKNGQAGSWVLAPFGD